MRKFRFVEFSRGTARKNPKMILNEYDRIIRDLKPLCDRLSKKSETLLIKLTESQSRNLRNTLELGIRRYHPEVEITFTYDHLKKLVFDIETNFAQELKYKEQLENVEEERKLFYNTYFKE